jgi:hypothetical protein
MEFTKSRRGKPILAHAGFVYNLEKSVNGIRRFRCRNRKCTGFLSINDKAEVLKQQQYNHASNYQAFKKIKMLDEIKKKSLNTKERFIHIYTEETSKQEEETIKLYHYTLPFAIPTRNLEIKLLLELKIKLKTFQNYFNIR